MTDALLVRHKEQLVVIVGNDHFLLTEQLPVVALRRPHKAKYLVEIVKSGSDRIGHVETYCRCSPYTTLPAQVLPSLARLRGKIGIVNEQNEFAVLVRRRQCLDVVVPIDSAE